MLASIGQLEFFYDQAPDVMRSCSMALQLLSTCIGSYLSGGIIWLVTIVTQPGDGGPGWLPKDLNNGRLDLFFLVLGGLMFVNFLMFLVVACRYEYKAVEHISPAAPRPPRARARPIGTPQEVGVVVMVVAAVWVWWLCMRRGAGMGVWLGCMSALGSNAWLWCLPSICMLLDKGLGTS